MKTLLSLFDYSGAWSYYFAANGWNVIQLDKKHGFDIKDIDSVETCFDLGIDDVDGIIAAVPCTDYAASGAHAWKEKDRTGQTEESNELVRQVLRLVDLFEPTDPDYDGTFFWALENPIGRIGKLFPALGQPYYFNPYEFAGFLDLSNNDLKELGRIRTKNGMDITKAEADFILRCNAYEKKTALYGKFNRQMKKRIITPVKGSPQGSVMQRFGGKSENTKQLRSETPLGFSLAFYKENCDYTYTWNS